MGAKWGEKDQAKVQAREEAIAYWLGNLHATVPMVAKKFGIPQSSLYLEIKQRGLQRSAAVQTKRNRVSQHFAGKLPSEIKRPGELTVDEQADEDIRDMEVCLSVARRVVRKYHRILDDDDALLDDMDMDPVEKMKLKLPPKELKVIAEGNNVAMETIRKIRGLDAPLDWDSLSDEQLERLAKGLPL